MRTSARPHRNAQIANHALLKIETRGATADINHYIRTQAQNIIAGAAHMYGVSHDTTLVGEAIHAEPSAELAARLAALARHSPHFTTVSERIDSTLGSEDASYFMQRVQERGGQATYCIIGTTLAAGHHHERFDIEETSLAAGVDILYRAAQALNGQTRA